MEHLHHNGVLVPPRYGGKGFTLRVKGEKITLTPAQEEMAFAWAKKVGTPYVDDPVFIENFHRDFSKKLERKLESGDIDYSEILSFVQKEREEKANLSKEKRKSLAAKRKAQREMNKEHYGIAWVDGAQIEVANYAVEPSSIFMGRGAHPLRGSWKEGPREEDVELNLSPEAPRPPGNWKCILWQPDTMWIARWKDKLAGKMKYVWFSDFSILKQKKDVAKFDKAKELRQNLNRVQRHIRKNLVSSDLKRRKIATVCFLIDKLKIRVGDEKDPDEADTVGASTLRSEHIHYNEDSTVTFNFLGKDSVPHIIKIKLPDNIIKNLREFALKTKSTLFDGVGSKHVSEFLDEAMPELSSKVFRTYYASKSVETKLEKATVELEDPEYQKKHVATLANLEAAKVCNHRRTIPKTWNSSLEKKRIRLKTLKKRGMMAQNKLREKSRELNERYKERLRKQEEKLNMLNKKLVTYREQLVNKPQQGNPRYVLERRIKLQRERVTRQKQRLKELKKKTTEQYRKLGKKLASRKQRDKTTIDKLKLRIETKKVTRDYNLATSLKSYIDPRIYYEWGRQVNYDWKKYYSKTLQKKFSWVELEGDTTNRQS